MEFGLIKLDSEVTTGGKDGFEGSHSEIVMALR